MDPAEIVGQLGERFGLSPELAQQAFEQFQANGLDASQLLQSGGLDQLLANLPEGLQGLLGTEGGLGGLVAGLGGGDQAGGLGQMLGGILGAGQSGPE